MSKQIDRLLNKFITLEVDVLQKIGCKLSQSSCTDSHSCSTSDIVASLPAHCAVSFLNGLICFDINITVSCV